MVDVRYTGGARMLLLIEVGQGRWRFKACPLASLMFVACDLGLPQALELFLQAAWQSSSPERTAYAHRMLCLLFAW